MDGGEGGDQDVVIPGPKRMDSVLGRSEKQLFLPLLVTGRHRVVASGSAACHRQRYETGVCTENEASLTHVLCPRLALSASPRGSCRDALEVPGIPYKPESNQKNGAHVLY